MSQDISFLWYNGGIVYLYNYAKIHRNTTNKKENFLDRRTEKIKGAQRLPESKTKKTTAQPHFYYNPDCCCSFDCNRSDCVNTAQPCKDNLCESRPDYRYIVQ